MEMMTAYETDGVLLVPFLRILLSAASGCETHNAHALRAPKHGTAAQFNTIPPTHAPRYETRVVEGNRDRCDLGTLSGQLQVFVVWYK